MSPASKKGGTNAETCLRMYRQMVRIRTFEDNANQLYQSVNQHRSLPRGQSTASE